MELLSKTIYKNFEEHVESLDSIIISGKISRDSVKSLVSEIDDLYILYCKTALEEKESSRWSSISFYREDRLREIEESRHIDMSKVEIRYDGKRFYSYETSLFGLISFPLTRKGFRGRIHCSSTTFYWAYEEARNLIWKRLPASNRVVF